MALSPTTLPFSALGVGVGGGAFARSRRPTITRKSSDECSDPELPDIDTFDLEQPAGHSSLRDLMLSPGKVMDAQLYQVLNSSWSEGELEMALSVAVARWEAFVPRAPSGTGYSRPVWPIDALVPRHYARHANRWDEFSPYDPASFRVPVRDTRSLLREVLRRASIQDPANAVGVPRRTASATVPRARHYQRSSLFSHRSSMTVNSRSPSPDAVPPNPAKFLTEHLKLFPDLHEAATDSSNSQNERYREALLRGQKDHLRSASSKRKEEYLALLERTRQQQRAQASAQAKRKSMFSPPPVTEVDERGLRRLSLMSSQHSEGARLSMPPARHSFVSTHTSLSLNEGQSTPGTSFTPPSSPEKHDPLDPLDLKRKHTSEPEVAHDELEPPLSAQSYHDATMGRLEGRPSVSAKHAEDEDEDVDLVLRLAEMGRKGMAGSLPPGVVESARAKRQASLGSALGSPLSPASTTPRIRGSYRESITSASSRGSRYPRSPRSPLSHSRSPSHAAHSLAAGFKHVRLAVPDSVPGDLDGDAHDPYALAADSPVESDANVVASAWHEGPLDGIGSGGGAGGGGIFGSDFSHGEASGRHHRASAAATARWRRATQSGSCGCARSASDRGSLSLAPLPAPSAETVAAHSAPAYPSRLTLRATTSMALGWENISRPMPPTLLPVAPAGCGTRSAIGCVHSLMLDATGRLPVLVPRHRSSGSEEFDTDEDEEAEEVDGPLMDISLDLDVDLDTLSFDLEGDHTVPNEQGDDDSPLMDLSIDLELRDEVHGPDGPDCDHLEARADHAQLELEDMELLDDFDLGNEEFDAFDADLPQCAWSHWHDSHDGDTESEPELQTPTFTPPFRPLSTISITSDVELDPRGIKLPLVATGASFVRRLAATGLRC